MRFIKIFFFFLFFLALSLESVFLPFPLTAIVFTLFLLLIRDDSSLLAFFGGILLDFFSWRPLGSDSLFFLLILWVVDRYREKIYIHNFLYSFFLMGMVTGVYSYLFYGYAKIAHLFLVAAISIFFLWFLGWLFPEVRREGKRLEI